MVFKLMKLHNMPFLFYEAPVCVIQTEQEIERNDPFLKLLIKIIQICKKTPNDDGFAAL